MPGPSRVSPFRQSLCAVWIGRLPLGSVRGFGIGTDPGDLGHACGITVALHRAEGCSCCAAYADYLRDNGFTVDMNTVDDLGPVRERYDVPEAAVGCHTSVIDDYVVEGHVPVEAIDRLLTERPAIDGISVVGMPTNSPGMGEPNGEPLDVLSFHNGRVRTTCRPPPSNSARPTLTRLVRQARWVGEGK